MYVEQRCHVSDKVAVPFTAYHVPWNIDDLYRMNKIQRKVPSLLLGCKVPYPHTHHFNVIRETT